MNVSLFKIFISNIKNCNYEQLLVYINSGIILSLSVISYTTLMNFIHMTGAARDRQKRKELIQTHPPTQ